MNRLARNECARERTVAERQFENDTAKAKSEPKLFHNHTKTKTTVKDQIIRLKKELT